MLNLVPIFEHAKSAFSEYGDALTIRPLPATVYLLQRDVINHYHHALTHYFPISLFEPYLQNSSIGSPYEKWRKFTNEDFDLLSFAIHNLIRYTSRLVYETVGVGLQKQNRHREIKRIMGDKYTAPLCDIKYHGRQIGLQVLAENALELTAFAQSLLPVRQEIGDRGVLTQFADAGHAENNVLKALNLEFGQLCFRFQSAGCLTIPYDSLNETWWV